jgi:hypothetical protein
MAGRHRCSKLLHRAGEGRAFGRGDWFAWNTIDERGVGVCDVNAFARGPCSSVFGGQNPHVCLEEIRNFRSSSVEIPTKAH